MRRSESPHSSPSPCSRTGSSPSRRYGNRGADFTEKQIHTLSDGTRAILGELDTPVVIRYYASRNTDYMPEEMKLHMRRVDDLLKEYSSLSKGKLRIENLDPQPDTDAEDSANLDGISGQHMDDQNLYFGLAVSCLDRTSVIPFIDPRDETMLEYHLSKAIAEVSMPTKPKIGIMSALDLKGGPRHDARPAPGATMGDLSATQAVLRSGGYSPWKPPSSIRRKSRSCCSSTRPASHRKPSSPWTNTCSTAAPSSPVLTPSPWPPR